MKRRTITWTWENPEAQELFVEWIKFPDDSQSSHEVDQMERLLDLRPPMRVLDLGCGKGRHALELARRGYQVTAIDVAAVYLQHAQRRAQEQHLAIEFRLQRGAELEENGIYDFVLAYNHTLGFMSTEELVQHFRRIWLALKPGGKFLLTLAGPKIMPNASPEKVRHWTEHGGRYLLSEKYLENGYQYERGAIIDTLADELIEYHEQQKAVAYDEVRSLLLTAGFDRLDCLRDLKGTPASADDFGVFVGYKELVDRRV
jgi:SAM-dependent methyltransferase